jgi:hypothetical protein
MALAVVLPFAYPSAGLQITGIGGLSGVDIFPDLLRYVATKFGDDVEYMVSGSTALQFYATPRMTRDLDVVVRLHPVDVPRVVEMFAMDCYISAEAVAEAVRMTGMFNVIHNDSVEKIDFIVCKADEYRRLELSRRRLLRCLDFQVYVVSPEDLVLSKLVWSRDSSSPMQHADITNLLHQAVGLDRDYLNEWSVKLGVAAALRALERP